MISLTFYTLAAVFTLALPLYLYKHPLWVIFSASLAELVAIYLIYGSTFVLCFEPENCGAEWTIWGIPALFATMNIGMIWPILGGYAKRAELEKQESEADN